MLYHTCLHTCIFFILFSILIQRMNSYGQHDYALCSNVWAASRSCTQNFLLHFSLFWLGNINQLHTYLITEMECKSPSSSSTLEVDDFCVIFLHKSLKNALWINRPILYFAVIFWMQPIKLSTSLKESCYSLCSLLCSLFLAY